MKLYVVVYVAVPLLTSAGTSRDKRRVEFSPGTVGSGEKVMEVSVSSDLPLEQSVTEEKPVVTMVENNSVARRNMFWITSA
jgi:hypothetical protein